MQAIRLLQRFSAMRYVERSSLFILIASIAMLAVRPAWMESIVIDTMMWMFASLAWIVYATLVYRRSKQQRHDSPHQPLIAFALCALLIIPVYGLFSDDAQRYLWDGIIVASGESPYASSPLQEPLVQHRTLLPDGVVLPDDMPYASMRTIYPPGMQLIAGGLVSVIGTPSRVAFEIAWWIVVVALLGIALRSCEVRDRSWIAVACMSPIVLLHGLGDIHSDVLMASMALLGVIALTRDRWIVAAVLIAIAISIKYVPILLIPALLRGRTRREKAILLGIVCAVVLATYLPFLVASGSIVGALPVFAAHWQANSFAYSLMSWMNHAWCTPECIRLVLGVCALALSVLVWRRQIAHPVAAAMMTYIAVLLCSPVVHAWYLMLPVLLLPFAPLRSTIVWATTMCVYGLFYATYKGDGVWFEHPVALAIEYIPVLFAFARDVQRGPLLLRDQKRASNTTLA